VSKDKSEEGKEVYERYSKLFEEIARARYPNEKPEIAIDLFWDAFLSYFIELSNIDINIIQNIPEIPEPQKIINPTKPKSIFDTPLSLTKQEFDKKYTTDDDCLNELFKLKITDPIERKKYKRVKERLCYINSQTNKQMYPLVGTMFESTSLPLLKWFTALFYYKHSDGKLTTKELAEIICVSYKTAVRVLSMIKSSKV
jgi:hypothetical protein